MAELGHEARVGGSIADWVIGLGLVAFAGMFLKTHVHPGLLPMEDASMLLRYSKNVADGHGVVWNVGEHPVEGATDFLYMLVIGLLARVAHAGVVPVGRTILFVSQLLTVGTMYVASRRVLRAPVWLGVFLAVYIAVGTAYHFVDSMFSAPFYGLFALLAWVAVYVMVDRGVTFGRAVGFSLLGLTVGLIRPEGVLIAGLMLCSALYGVRARRGMLVGVFFAVFAVLGGAYFVWRLRYFGHLLPNPFYVKHVYLLFNSVIAARIETEFLLPVLPLLGLGFLPSLRKRLGIVLITLVPFLGMWSIISLDNNAYGRFQYVLIAVMVFSLGDLAAGGLRLVAPAMAKEREFGRVMGAVAGAMALFTVFYLLHLDRNVFVNPGGHDLGARLQPMASKGYTLVSTEAGLLPFYSEWKAVDALALNDEFLAHHGGLLTTEYLDRYKPELMLYHQFSLGPLPPLSPAEQASAEKNFGARVPLVATEIRNYAESHGYILAAVYGASYCNFHYIWVRSGQPDTDRIVSAVRDYPYGWQGDGALAFDFRAEDGHDTCRQAGVGVLGRPI